MQHLVMLALERFTRFHRFRVAFEGFFGPTRAASVFDVETKQIGELFRNLCPPMLRLRPELYFHHAIEL